MKILKQGDLDGMCGAYSVCHSVSYVTDASDEKIRKLFSGLCIDLRTIAPYFVYGGMYFKDLNALVKGINAWLPDKLHVKTSLPFFKRRFDSVEEYGQALGAVINGQNKCAILGFGEPWNHWAVADSVKPKSFRLIDSSQDNCEIVRFSGLTLKAKTPDQIRIHPRHTFVFERK